MKVVVIINPAAGAMTHGAEDRIRQALHLSGLHGADVVKLDFGDHASRIAEVVEASPDLLVVWGGDGTHRAALSAVGLRASNLLLLPGGTMNLLSKSLHGDKRWEQILQSVIASPTTRVLPAGKIEGHVFYCAMLAGAPVRLAEARESFRHGDVGAGLVHLGEALGVLQTLHLAARYSDGYRFNNEQQPITSVVGALVGPMSRNSRMEVFTLAHPSRMSALNLAWSSMVSSWRDAEGVAIVAADTLDIDSEKGTAIPVIIDGEEIAIGSHARVIYVPEASRCLIVKN